MCSTGRISFSFCLVTVIVLDEQQRFFVCFGSVKIVLCVRFGQISMRLGPEAWFLARSQVGALYTVFQMSTNLYVCYGWCYEYVLQVTTQRYKCELNSRTKGTVPLSIKTSNKKQFSSICCYSSNKSTYIVCENVSYLTITVHEIQPGDRQDSGLPFRCRILNQTLHKVMKQAFCYTKLCNQFGPFFF